MAHGHRHCAADSTRASFLSFTPDPTFKERLQIMPPLRKRREVWAPTAQQVAAILAEDVVMHSPVLIRPIIGRDVVAVTISNSSHSRDDPGKYIFEGKLDDRTTLLRGQGTVEGHKIESLELLTDNEEGLLVERTIAYRPFPAVKIFRDKLIALNKAKLTAEMME